MPSMKLTKSAVASARPEARDYEIRDTIVPGFFLQDHACRAQGLHALLSHAKGRAPQAFARHLRARSQSTKHASSRRTSSRAFEAARIQARSGRRPAPRRR